MNKYDSAQAARKALEAGAILHVTAPAGKYTAGPLTTAVASRYAAPRFVAYGYGKSRHITPQYEGDARDVSWFLVENAGRGAVTKAVREAKYPAARRSR
jgi:hypothetical protein